MVVGKHFNRSISAKAVTVHILTYTKNTAKSLRKFLKQGLYKYN